MKAMISGISYTVPDKVLSNEELAKDFPEWSAERIEKKIGINKRHICCEGECATDLAVKAAESLILSKNIDRECIDFVVLCTQSPDYILPTSACLVQSRLGLPNACGALDFNLGCSGYVYGLGLVKGLIESGQANNVLLITAETYSKYIEKTDKNVRTLFGDAATVTWIKGVNAESDLIGPFVYGTDGTGAQNLIVESGASRFRCGIGDPFLRMDGPAIFAFTLKAVPDAINKLLNTIERDISSIDLFVLHQANAFMLDYLRKKSKIPEEKFVYALRDFGNTVSSSIPIALVEAEKAGVLKQGMEVMLVGFGVGLSWGACMVKWS